eukprot:snap_masked-scaffold_6-processed-gene-4.28-mRNA-1 protein AED:1.00 eAED:1.00 QI:0/-1/0/0/-1/1/1/0/61
MKYINKGAHGEAEIPPTHSYDWTMERETDRTKRMNSFASINNKQQDYFRNMIYSLISWLVD